MSNTYQWALKGTRKLFSGVFGHSISKQVGLEKPKKPTIPGVPTIDTAAKNIQESDRIRRRKGVLATVFGGASATAPTTASKTLLGS